MHVFTETLNEWLENISINSIIMMIMMVFLVIGAVDRILGNRTGYGREFEKGFETIGPIALSIAAIIAISPLISSVFSPIISPAFDLIGADSSMFPAMFLGADMGGYALAMDMAKDPSIGKFSGLIVASSIGPTLTFTIPIALSVLRRQDRGYLAVGVLAGMITVPLGCLTGGLAMNMTEYKIDIVTILVNLIPISIFAVIIITCLWFFPVTIIKIFNGMGTGIMIIVTILSTIAIFQQTTGIMFPGLSIMSIPDETSGMTGLDEGLLLSGQIGIALAGAFPMVRWLTNVLQGPFKTIGRILHINELSCAGLLTTMANFIPMLSMFRDFDEKGKLLNITFTVCGLAVFGDFLGFTAGVDQQMVAPMIIGKIVAAVTAVLIASLLSPRLLEHVKSPE